VRRYSENDNDVLLAGIPVHGEPMGKRTVGRAGRDTLIGSDILVRSLERLGVPQVWGFPGHVPTFIRELNGSAIDYVPTRHAQAVAFAAEVVGRYASRPSVCYASLKLDAVNLMTAVAHAYLIGAPVLILLDGTQNAADEFALVLQSDLVTQMRPLLKFTQSVTCASEIPAALDRAHHAALHGRPGPVVLRLAHSALSAQVTEELDLKASRPVVLESPRTVEYQQIDSVYQALRACQAPLIVAGDEIVRTGAEDEFRAFVEHFEIPVFTTLDAKGVVPEDHPLSLGPLAEGFDDAYDPIVSAADLIMFAGCDSMTDIPNSLRRNVESARVINIGISLDSAPEFTRNGTHMVTNLRTLFKLLAAQNPGVRPMRPELSGFRGRVREILNTRATGSVYLVTLLDIMRAHLHPDDVIVCDVSLSAPVAVYYQALRPRTVVFSAPSALGFEIPGAIGIKSTDPSRRVVALCARPSLLFSVQEIETSVRSDLPIVVVLLETDSVPEGRGVSLTPAGKVPFMNDVVALVNSLGAVAVQARTVAEFERAFREACPSPLTTLIVAPPAIENTTPALPRKIATRVGN